MIQDFKICLESMNHVKIGGNKKIKGPSSH